MKPFSTIYLVRHGESVTNRDGLVGGQIDTPLTETGKQQALRTKETLKHVNFDVAYSSDLQRARDTAEIIDGKPLATSNQLLGLRERNFGKFEGKPNEHLRRLQEVHSKRYKNLSREERWKYAYADSVESDHLLSSRFFKALQTIAKHHIGETVLVVTHGGCIRTTLFKLGYFNEEELPPGTFSNAGFVELTYDDKTFKIKRVVGIKKKKTETV